MGNPNQTSDISILNVKLADDGVDTLGQLKGAYTCLFFIVLGRNHNTTHRDPSTVLKDMDSTSNGKNLKQSSFKQMVNPTVGASPAEQKSEPKSDLYNHSSQYPIANDIYKMWLCVLHQTKQQNIGSKGGNTVPSKQLVHLPVYVDFWQDA